MSLDIKNTYFGSVYQKVQAKNSTSYVEIKWKKLWNYLCRLLITRYPVYLVEKSCLCCISLHEQHWVPVFVDFISCLMVGSVFPQLFMYIGVALAMLASNASWSITAHTTRLAALRVRHQSFQHTTSNISCHVSDEIACPSG